MTGKLDNHFQVFRAVWKICFRKNSKKSRKKWNPGKNRDGKCWKWLTKFSRFSRTGKFAGVPHRITSDPLENVPKCFHRIPSSLCFLHRRCRVIPSLCRLLSSVVVSAGAGRANTPGPDAESRTSAPSHAVVSLPRPPSHLSNKIYWFSTESACRLLCPVESSERIWFISRKTCSILEGIIPSVCAAHFLCPSVSNLQFAIGN